MNRKRTIETNVGIQSKTAAADFDRLQRGFRDRGQLQTEAIIKSGIDAGTVVELGPGPGYLGLEWLAATENTSLIGIEISRAMIRLAENNRSSYGLDGRADYIEGSALEIPLDDQSADNIFSNGSLHEWENPYTVLNEAYRILKPGGKLFIGDLKRNLSLPVTLLMLLSTKGKAMQRGLMTSVNAAYTCDEVSRLGEWSLFNKFEITESPWGLIFTAGRQQ